MTSLLDTNILVRHFTGDPPDQARRATAFLREARSLMLTDVAFAETAYVLESYYRAPRAVVAGHLRAAMSTPSVRVDDPDALHRALELYERGLHFVESYLVARAESEAADSVVSFDRGIDRVATVRRVEP